MSNRFECANPQSIIAYRLSLMIRLPSQSAITCSPLNRCFQASLHRIQDHCCETQNKDEGGPSCAWRSWIAYAVRVSPVPRML